MSNRPLLGPKPSVSPRDYTPINEKPPVCFLQQGVRLNLKIVQLANTYPHRLPNWAARVTGLILALVIHGTNILIGIYTCKCLAEFFFAQWLGLATFPLCDLFNQPYRMKSVYIIFMLLLCTAGYSQQCRGIQKKVSKFDQKTEYLAYVTGPMLAVGGGTSVDVMIVGKTVMPADTIYILSLAASIAGTRELADLKGITLLFSDGSRITKENQTLKFSFGRYLNTVSGDMLLTAEEFEQFRTKTLTDAKLANDELTVHPKMAKSLNTQSACLMQTW